MGHLVGKDIYRKLGKKLDGLTVRTPWNDTLHAMLRELYSEVEADIIVKMPYGLASVGKIARVTGYEESVLQPHLDRLADKGLLVDVWVRDRYRYVISPMVIGIFEFTMMRTGDGVDSEKCARLFKEYLVDSSAFWDANFSKGQQTSLMRAIPHEQTMEDYMEVLDYEKAAEIIQSNSKFSIGLCSCRHEKLHTGDKHCDVPLETCSTFGSGAEYLIRHNLAKEVSKAEMLENLARSREMGLVINADNVQKNVGFMCHCCGCCCNALLGISKHGYEHAVMTSSYIARVNEDTCTGCSLCETACPVNAISMAPLADNPKRKKAVIDQSLCLGCGVCVLKCRPESVKLKKREQRVIHPEDTFERIMMQCLEQGTLQNFIFSNPSDFSHKFMRGFVGGFLKLPPIKRALMSDTLKSRFLSAIRKRA